MCGHETNILAFLLTHFPHFYHVQCQVISSAPLFNIIHRATVAEQSPRYKVRLPYFPSPFGPLPLRGLFRHFHRCTVCDETIRQGTSTPSQMKHLDILQRLITEHSAWTAPVNKTADPKQVCTNGMGIFTPIRYHTGGKTTSRFGRVCRVATLHPDTARQHPFSVPKATPDSLHQLCSVLECFSLKTVQRWEN